MRDDDIPWSDLGEDAETVSRRLEKIAETELVRSDFDARAAAIAAQERLSRAMVASQRFWRT